MAINDPAIFYLGLILPGLFALTLVIEGVHKILREEPGWVSLIIGTTALLIIILAYFIFLR